jgi:hypothetical protein
LVSRSRLFSLHHLSQALELVLPSGRVVCKMPYSGPYTPLLLFFRGLLRGAASLSRKGVLTAFTKNTRG